MRHWFFNAARLPTSKELEDLINSPHFNEFMKLIMEYTALNILKKPMQLSIKVKKISLRLPRCQTLYLLFLRADVA